MSQLATLAILISLAYLAFLFALASWGDRRAEQGRSVIANPYIYTLSLAVYCTAWTYFGSVGVAAGQGVGFLPVYLGPTLLALLFLGPVRKILLIAKAYGITSIADFASARYGKSGAVAGLVTIVALVGSIPYISLQLKAVATGIELLLAHDGADAQGALGADSALLVALVLAAFSILFGTRHIDATEHHQGMVLAIAFESIVKLLCFLAVGVFVTWVLFAGPSDLLARAEAAGIVDRLHFSATRLGYADWFLLTLLSAFAVLLLPRQFQVVVIENLEIGHLRRASWMFPCYLLIINLFVLPIALAGLILGGTVAEADSFVLRLPLVHGQGWLAIVAFLGGLSAATAMVIVETVAVSTMISNDLVMPLLLRIRSLGLAQRPDLTGLILGVRRAGILLAIAGGYLFFHSVGEAMGLVSIGYIAFAGVAQFAPLLLLGIAWKGANRNGAVVGLLAGFSVWLYTLVLPSFVTAGVLPESLLREGPFGVALLRPTALFGLEGLHPVAHCTLWSLSANTGLLVLVSLLTRASDLERLQAILFVDVEQSRRTPRLWRGEAKVGALEELLVRFLGRPAAEAIWRAETARRGRPLDPDEPADAGLVERAERQLARAIGAASARAVVASAVRGESIGPDALLEILDETQKVIEYSRRLEQKSQELEAATAELRHANERLRELDRLKDDFLATVSHELRTPLTSIRSFSEILLDNPDLGAEERAHFLRIITSESERLTRLINDVLDLSKIESGRMDWQIGPADLAELVREGIRAAQGLVAEKGVELEVAIPDEPAPVTCDRDRIVQVVLNLLSNACKFVPRPGGRVRVELQRKGPMFEIRVEDNGPGVPPAARELVFEKFHQLTGDLNTQKPTGTGLGLTISKQIVERFGGRIWVEDARLGGAALCFTLPVAESPSAVRAAA
ncbi:MAG: sensor histidine kinase [Geminicoccaceae bacterium]|nr:sensor histidine kinase [Geminicoccaceae bacterium]MCS7268480.1 sensor histidine kinase [Geminicoccaceae bacterium]MCX7629527.1 sensor histidine kinase [Geminicoccaceae bacterium]MDW8124370.1 sensor histidine kinase [Geminicoccaceae bacterium]MDW8340858.1 sensor histidine kinase [Geminicoccaceae bacterium]